jgi:hypothetical protein
MSHPISLPRKLLSLSIHGRKSPSTPKVTITALHPKPIKSWKSYAILKIDNSN